MFLRNLIFYTVAGSVLWVIAQRLGAGIGVALAASLLLPPLALLSYTLYFSFLFRGLQPLPVSIELLNSLFSPQILHFPLLSGPAEVSIIQ